MGTDLPYETDQPNAYKWTDRAYDLLGATLHASVTAVRDVHTARADGECPRCGHDVRFEQVLDIVTGEDLGTLGAAASRQAVDEFVPLTVQCRCTETHPGRDDTVLHGCGINFRVDVRPGA